MLLRNIGLAWLILLAGIALGMYIFTARVWPYPVLKEVMAFVAGHPAEETSIAEKLENDLDLKPSQQAY
ncbi:MAG: hypothetical protein GWN27_14000 [candidate division Zixibacteria bacterium]|nr:hypothetical protein [candidate division Zixibacteria bacterium]NIS47630.1 hypothetical protein [candidate division Zixibacteria bacterium]NIW41584.1 hypothetical protein [candidate division Zixibacteria bacterium]